MNMGHHVLPSARRGNGELDRYIRSEYGERDACWFRSGAANGQCLRLPGENVLMGGTTKSMKGPSASEQQARCCPVMSSLADSGLFDGQSARGELAGKQ